MPFIPWKRVVCLAAVCAGCNHPADSAKSGAGGSDKAPLTFTLAKPQKSTLQRSIEQPGQIEAFEETPMVARIPGNVKRVLVDMGDRITGPKFDSKGKEMEPGQVLAELYVPDMEEELQQKKALVSQAEAEVEQAQASLDAAEAHVETAKALVHEAEAGVARAQANYARWHSEYVRLEELVRNQVIDRQIRDETLNQFKSAEAAKKEVEAKVQSYTAMVKESQAQRDKAKADLSAARAKVRVARADEQRLAALFDYRLFRAPYDGVVVRRQVHTGHFLQPATGANVQPIFVVARTDLLRIFVEVPETEAQFVSEGLAAKVRVLSLKDQEFPGAVTRTSWALDPKSRTLRAEIDLPNPSGKLRPGMYAYVTLKAEVPDRLSLPAAAVLTQGDQTFCFRHEAGKAIKTPLKLGLKGVNLVEVLKIQVKTATGEPAWQNPTGDEPILVGNLSEVSDGQSVTLGK